MASQRKKLLSVFATPPPRTLDVQKFAESRASELESLHSILANRVNHDFRSRRNKRRRTTGYDNRTLKSRRKKRRKLGKSDEEGVPVPEKDQKLSRRIRRRIEFKKNPESGFCTSGDGTKRLRTHVWHVKRFVMVKKWGFNLPLGLHGRGRGSRAVLKWLKFGSVLHDASYSSAVQLEGQEDSLMTILSMVLVPSPPIVPEGLSCPVTCGVCYGSGMLHHIGSPLSHLIAPVTYMWRPCCRDQTSIEVGEDPISNGSCLRSKSQCNTSFRQLWIWIHAAAFNEGYATLKSASKKLMHENGVSVNCFSLDGKLARLEVMGSKALKILQKILDPISSDTNNENQKASILTHAEYLPPHAILSLTVRDPRDLDVKKIDCITEAASTSLEDNMQEQEDVKGHATVPPNNTKEIMSSLWLKPDGDIGSFCDSKELWASHDQMNLPTEDYLLCMERHERRLASFVLDGVSSGTSTAQTMESSTRSCSILLLKNSNQRDSGMGWSIILPLTWVKAFWIPLVSHGAHAVGLREWRWIACDNGMPFFPFDFPDCKAYSCFMEVEAAESDQTAELCPLAMRSPRVPVPPPWKCVRFAIEEGCTTTSTGHTQMDVQINAKEMIGDISLAMADGEKCDHELLEQEQDGALFGGFVLRTSSSLGNYLNRINGGHLLLFPYTSIRQKGFNDNINAEKLSWALGSVNKTPVDREMCFVRVLLHAYKKGFFEEGALVCAPILTDISLWTSRSDERDGLEIPQSLLKSYFIQQQSGKWELQLPDDPVNRQFYRWPIGFVTAGFVRGSKKLVAEALCEATVLGHLRREQWGEMQEEKRHQIFVLVRNLRSTAYGLGLATIVLEHQEEDVEAM